MDSKTQNTVPVLPLPQTAILYQNPDKTVTSPWHPTINIAVSMHPNPSLKICSTPPLQTPFPSLQPKSEAARAKVIRATGFNIDLGFPNCLLHEELEEIKENYEFKGDWCLPRCLSKALLESVRKEVKRGVI